MQHESDGWTLDLVMTLKVDVCKVNYARDGVQGLIITFGICKMRINDQEANFVNGQVDKV